MMDLPGPGTRSVRACIPLHACRLLARSGDSTLPELREFAQDAYHLPLVAFTWTMFAASIKRSSGEPKLRSSTKKHRDTGQELSRPYHFERQQQMVRIRNPYNRQRHSRPDPPRAFRRRYPRSSGAGQVRLDLLPILQLWLLHDRALQCRLCYCKLHHWTLHSNCVAVSRDWHWRPPWAWRCRHHKRRREDCVACQQRWRKVVVYCDHQN